MKRSSGLLGIALCAAAGPGLRGASAAETPGVKPDILVIIADDLTHSEVGCYGGRNVKTPNIDRLAGEGMRFTHAYAAMAMCTPSRTELYTGLYPVRSGAVWNHSATQPGTESICHFLGGLGYRVGLTGKKHILPRKTFPFVNVPGFEPNCVALTADYNCDGIREFMSSPPEQPFCLVVASTHSHMPWSTGNPERFDRAAIQLPPNFADTPEMRLDFSKYLAEIALFDQQVGDILKALEETGRADNTLVLLTTEQGAQFPFSKWTCWEQGLHTALIARWPGKVPPGTETDALVQYADVAPTLIEAAGGDAVIRNLDGISFLDVLRGRSDGHRTYVYGLHNNVPEGPAYPIRTIRSGEYRYILNLTPAAQYYEKHMEFPEEETSWWASWKKAAVTGDAHALEMLNRYRSRPEEQLYKSDEDPYEMTDLARSPEYAAVKAELRAQLDLWMTRQSDPGAELDSRELLDANRQAVGIRPVK
jgi:uncharacterized sulfatase